MAALRITRILSTLFWDFRESIFLDRLSGERTCRKQIDIMLDLMDE